MLARGRGLLEETLVPVPTPQSLVTEGMAGSRRTYVAGEPERFRRLLTEQVRVRHVIDRSGAYSASRPAR